MFPNLGKILPLMGYLASGDIFGCHSYGREMLLAIYWLERKDDAKDTIMHRTASHNQELLVPKYR